MCRSGNSQKIFGFYKKVSKFKVEGKNILKNVKKSDFLGFSGVMKATPGFIKIDKKPCVKCLHKMFANLPKMLYLIKNLLKTLMIPINPNLASKI